MRRTLGELEKKRVKLEFAMKQDPLAEDFDSDQDRKGDLSKIEEEDNTFSQNLSPRNGAPPEKAKRKITVKYSDSNPDTSPVPGGFSEKR